jgi:YVTN family beta-propeller protein
MKLPSSLALLPFLAVPVFGQHVQVSALAVDPLDAAVVWVCNRDNDSVSRVDTASGNVVEIDVGVKPRSLAVTPDGALVLVANQRGDIPLDVNFVTPFSGAELRGSVSVIDTATRTVVNELAGVGVEPYGLAIDPAGLWFAVSGFRSGTLRFFELATLNPTHTHQYERNLNFLTQGSVLDHDANRDGLADLADPRGFVIRADSARMWVTHNKSPYVSVLDLTLDAGGLVTGSSLAAKIDVNDYPFDPFYNPVPVQTIESQGMPRFLEDIALSPDGTRALVPHLLHNVAHDVTHDFGSALAGDFANRVYPALTLIDAAQNTFGQAGDASRRLEHELASDPTPAEYAAYGSSALTGSGDRLVLGGLGSPVLGGTASFVLSGFQAGDSAILLIGKRATEVDMGA